MKKRSNRRAHGLRSVTLVSHRAPSLSALPPAALLENSCVRLLKGRLPMSHPRPSHVWLQFHGESRYCG